MQSSSPWSDVINYLAIDPWVSGILGGPPSHIHQAWSLQPSLSGNASNTHSSPQHGLLLRYNTDSYLHEERIEPGGLHYTPRCFGFLACVRFLILYHLNATQTWSKRVKATAAVRKKNTSTVFSLS